VVVVSVVVQEEKGAEDAGVLGEGQKRFPHRSMSVVDSTLGRTNEKALDPCLMAASVADAAD